MPDEQKPKRKTHTSTAVKARYNAKTYKQYSVAFRYDDDKDLLNRIDAFLVNGYSAAQAIKAIMRGE